MTNKPLDFSDLDASLPEVSPAQLQPEAVSLDEQFSPEDEQSILQEIDLNRKYGDSSLRTAVESGLSAATFGATDALVDAYGTPETKEGVRERRARNEEAALLGTVAGTVGPALLSGGTSLAAKGASAGARAAARAGAATERALTQASKSFIKDASNKTLAKEIVGKVLPKAAGIAVESVPYSVGTLVSESALGNADINAENLMAVAGTGALLGIGSAAAGQLAGKGLTKLKGSEFVKKVKGKFGDVFDPESAALDYSGLTLKEREIARRTNPNFGKDLVDYYKTNLGMKLTDTPETIAFKNAKVLEQSGKEIDNIIEAVTNSPNGFVSKKKLYTQLADKIDSEVVAPFKAQMDLREFQRLTKAARNMKEDFQKLANKPGNVTAREMQTLRKKMDDLAKFKNLGEQTSTQEAARSARRVLRTAIDDLAAEASPQLADALKKANKAYSIAITLEKPLTKKVDKQSFLSFKDMILGTIGAGVGGEEGLALAAGGKFLQSDLKRRLVILGAIEKANKKVASAVSSSLSKFISGTKSAYIPVSSKILAESNLTRKDKEEKLQKPKTQQEAAQNLRENVNKLVSDPAYLERKIMAKFYNLQSAAPETAAAALQITNSAIQFLKSKMPSMGSGSSTIYGKQSFISDFEVGKIARYVQTIEDPMSALKELESGTLTREHVEALKAVYPKIYQDVVVKTMQMIESKPNMSYQKKIQLGILLDITTDETMSPEFILNRQAQYMPKEPENAQQSTQSMVEPTQGGAASLSFNNRYMSASEDLLNEDT